MNTRISALIIFAAVLSIAVAPATAQLSDWLKKGEELLGGGSGQGTTGGGLSVGEIAGGLKEALRVGSARVVKRVGKTDGYNKDPAIHLPLPDSLQSAQSALRSVGLSSLLDDFELRLNRAAEVAAPKAKKLFIDAITEMTLDDARRIYNGPDDSATRYFQGKMTKPLAGEMRPVVDESLSQVGAVRSYDRMMGQYRQIPFVPDVKADLTDYVVEKGMDGIFYYLAKEEAAIRRNPAKRTTEILRKVFGAS
jgi:hypothetical protein